MTILVNSVVSGGGDNDQMIISTYTLAQIEALALAGGLTPYATYIPSDASPPYQLWARDASTLGSPLGGDYINVEVAGAGRATIEV